MEKNARLRQLIDGYRQTALLYAAVRLCVPDLLADGALTLEELAARAGVEAERLERLLRGLVVMEIVATQADGRWVLTELGAGLRGGAAGGLGAAALIAGAEYAPAWGAMAHTLRTGETAFDHVFGQDAWAHRRANPELGEAFQTWLKAAMGDSVSVIVRALELGAVKTVADVGGGQGGLLRAVLEARPEVTGWLVDQPRVVEAASRGFAQAGLAERCRFEGADFFASVPGGADVYLLKSVLHDWADEDCVKILRNCGKAMGTGARLLVIERLLPTDPARDPFVVMQDLHMLAVLGGRERGEGEFVKLAREAGLAWRKTAPTETGFFVLEFARDEGGGEASVKAGETGGQVGEAVL